MILIIFGYFDALFIPKRILSILVRKRSGDLNLVRDRIKIMLMKVSQGLAFHVVALPGVGHMPAVGEDENEAARTMQKLVIGVGGAGGFGRRLES